MNKQGFIPNKAQTYKFDHYMLKFVSLRLVLMVVDSAVDEVPDIATNADYGFKWHCTIAALGDHEGRPDPLDAYGT